VCHKQFARLSHVKRHMLTHTWIWCVSQAVCWSWKY